MGFLFQHTRFIEEYFINQTKISVLELQLRIRHLFFPFLHTDRLNKGYYVYTYIKNYLFALKMTIRSVCNHTTKFCNRCNSTDMNRINGTDVWGVTSCTVDAGSSTTPYNVLQSTMIRGVVFWQTVFRYGS